MYYKKLRYALFLSNSLYVVCRTSILPAFIVTYFCYYCVNFVSHFNDKNKFFMDYDLSIQFHSTVVVVIAYLCRISYGPLW